MAMPTLPAPAALFKGLSLEHQQLRLTVQLLQTFAVRALVRGHELDDQRLVIILDQLEMLLAKAQRLMDEMESAAGR